MCVLKRDAKIKYLATTSKDTANKKRERGLRETLTLSVADTTSILLQPLSSTAGKDLGRVAIAMVDQVAQYQVV